MFLVMKVKIYLLFLPLWATISFGSQSILTLFIVVSKVDENIALSTIFQIQNISIGIQYYNDITVHVFDETIIKIISTQSSMTTMAWVQVTYPDLSCKIEMVDREWPNLT